MKNRLNQDSLRRMNDSRVVRLLRNGPMTRRRLQELTGLSWGGVTNTVNRLTRAGFIAPCRAESGPAGGRTPSASALIEYDNLILGTDVNLTGLTGCVMSLTGRVLCEGAAPAELSSPEALTGGLARFMKELMARCPGAGFLAAGISMQGEVDPERGISVSFGGVPGWENVPLRDIIADALGLPVHIAHDPDCMLHACLAEAPAKDALLMRLDTNVGMAVSINGRMITGCGLMEAGHMVVDPAGPVCSCGRRGCLAAYAARCMQGEYSAIEAPLALAVQGLIQLFRPSRVILAGDMMAHAPRFMAGFMEKYSALGCSAEIVMLSDALSAMRGAALIAADAATDDLDINEETDSGGDEP